MMPEPVPFTRRFRSTLWRPPRAHGETIHDRSVSFLELFYDLVFVVLVAILAHGLAHHISWGEVGRFAVLFGLVWLAWVNGAAFHEIHGRDDSRSRTYVFAQMLILAVMAMFLTDATGEGGMGFALAYGAYNLLLTWLWFTARQQDTQEHHRRTAATYITAMLIVTAIMVASAFMPEPWMFATWTALALTWVVIFAVIPMVRGSDAQIEELVTESMVERFDLFTIIVLGEVVVGTVNGVEAVGRSPLTIVTALIGMTLAFAFWWTYFDFAGRRLPVPRRGPFGVWQISHLPRTMAIAATGGALTAVIAEAGEPRIGSSAAWLLAGSSTLLLLSIVMTIPTLQDFTRLERVYRPLVVALLLGAGLSLFVAFFQPVSWLFLLVLVLIQAVIWFFAVYRWLTIYPDEAAPEAAEG